MLQTTQPVRAELGLPKNGREFGPRTIDGRILPIPIPTLIPKRNRSGEDGY